jgi:phenylacetate-coenzyme A ligase PaaK-like adenylate-forming protein
LASAFARPHPETTFRDCARILAIANCGKRVTMGVGRSEMVVSLSMPQEIRRRVQSWVTPLVISLGLRRRLQLLAERLERYRSPPDPPRIERWQVSAFNEIWQRARHRYRFYRDWQRRHGLPDQLGHIDQLRDFPILTAVHIEENLARIAADAAPSRMIFTGGSSGQTRAFPRGAEDPALLYANMYLGRSWAGVRPGDRIVSIWGHEHLFGAGALGRLRKTRRQLMDWLVGTRRLSVYRLDDRSVEGYFEAIKAQPGAVLIGYTSAIKKLLDFVEHSGADGRSAGIRVVIFCSEPVSPHDFERVRRLLSSIPVIEYGMQETGAMAYSRPGSMNLTFIWDAFHCWATATRELVVTTLQPVRFPLINYGTGDLIDPFEDASGTLPFRCSRIAGRARDILSLTLMDGRRVETHSEIIVDVLDTLSPRIRSYLIHQKGDIIDIGVRTNPGHDLAAIRDRFLLEIRREFPDIDETRFTFSSLDRERLTVAGKQKYVIRD